MSTDTHTEERERLEDELRRIDATLSNGWIQTKPARLAALTERRIEVMESLAAMDADESIDASFDVVRELNIDTDYQMKKALAFTRSLVGSNRQAALLNQLRMAKVNYSKAIEAAVKAAGMEPA